MRGRLIEVIDDQQDIRDNLRALFEGEGWVVATYVSAEDILPTISRKIRLSACRRLFAGMVGMELLRLLKESHHRFPVIVITGRSDVRMAINAIALWCGRFSSRSLFLTRTYIAAYSWPSSDRAMRTSAKSGAKRRAPHWRCLPASNRQILDRIVQGQANKVIAADLKLSQRTSKIIAPPSCGERNPLRCRPCCALC